MSKKLPYILVQEATPDHLAYSVNERMKEGYRPSGGIVLYTSNVPRLIQPMVLNEEKALIWPP